MKLDRDETQQFLHRGIRKHLARGLQPQDLLARADAQAVAGVESDAPFGEGVRKFLGQRRRQGRVQRSAASRLIAARADADEEAQRGGDGEGQGADRFARLRDAAQIRPNGRLPPVAHNGKAGQAVKNTGILLLAAAVWLAASPARAQEPDAAPAHPAKAPAHPVKARAKPKPVAQSGDALPCPRAKYQGDPVCFGVNDPAALPLPTAGSGVAAAHRAEDPTITAKTLLNQEAYPDPTHGNNPTPNPSNNDFGGMVGVGVHF